MGAISVPLGIIPFSNCHISVSPITSVCTLRNGIPRYNIAKHTKVSASF